MYPLGGFVLLYYEEGRYGIHLTLLLWQHLI
jgi:hypothetical protein